MPEKPTRHTTLWRYMSFSRFVWTVTSKSLWLSRADLLGDEWEMGLTRDEVRAATDIIARQDGLDQEAARSRLAAHVQDLRKRTFVNCWTASKAESHAMWSLYCGARDGVAVQTTYEELRKSVNVPIVRVNYDKKRMRYPFSPLILATRKRRPFSYEQELRIVWNEIGLTDDARNFLLGPKAVSAGLLTLSTLGFAIDWNVEQCIRRVVLHPRADPSNEKTVRDVVGHFAPALQDRIAYSRMTKAPDL